MGRSAQVKAGFNSGWNKGGRPGKQRFISVLIASTMLGGVNLYAPAVAYAQQQPAVQAVNFDIPAQPLASAIKQFIRVTGWEVGFNSPTVVGKQSVAVKGQMAPAQALKTLLGGTGLNAQISGPSTAALVASTGSATGPVAADGSTMLDTINVQGQGGTTEGSGSYTTSEMSTATKLPISIRETPQSVSVVTRQKMDDKGYQTLDQAIADAPGMAVVNGLGSTRYTYMSRGLALDNIQYNGAPSNIHYYTRDIDQADDLDLYDRVEILRGASGLSEGAGNPSGAINLIRKQPLSVNKTTIEAVGSSWGNGKVMLDTSHVLNEEGTLRGRLVGSVLAGDSYIDFTSNKAGTIYGVVEADLGESTTLSVGYSYKHQKLDGYDWTGLVTRPDGSFYNFDTSTFLGDAGDYADRTQHALYVDATHEFDNGWELKVASRASWAKAYFLNATKYYDDDDELFYRSSRQFDYDNTVFSADANLSGKVELFGREHDLVFGVNGGRSDIELTTLNPNVWYAFDPTNWDPRTPLSYTNWTKSYIAEFVNSQYGFYAQSRLNVSDDLKVFLGGRVSWYENDLINTNTSTYARTTTVTEENAKFIPYVAGVYDLTGSLSIYASYTGIFKPQSTNWSTSGPLSPVEGTNVEIGLKQELFDGRLTASAAVFETKRDNVAARISGMNSCGPLGSDSCYEGVNGIRTRGFEVEASGEVFDNLHLSGSYTYASSKYTEGQNAGKKFSTEDYPEHIFKLFGSYTFAEDKMTVGAGIRAQTKTYYKDAIIDVEQPFYSVVDAMAQYRFTEQTSLRLNVSNLFDRRYYSSISNDVATGFRLGAPREFKLSLKHEF